MALLVATLGACADDSTDVEDYRALMEAYMALREYSFSGDLSLEFDNPSHNEVFGVPTRTAISGTVSTDRQEMRMRHAHSGIGDRPGFEMEMFSMETGVFIEMAPILQLFFEFMMGLMEVEGGSISAETYLGGRNYYVFFPADFLDEGALLAPMELGGRIPTQALAPLLSREGDVFTLTFEGEMLGEIRGELGETLGQVSVSRDYMNMGIHAVDFDLDELLRSVNWATAHVVVTMSRTGNTFHQVTEIVAPGNFTSVTRMTFVEEAVAPIIPPEEVMTLEAFEAFTAYIDFADLFGGVPTENIFGAEQFEFEVLQDLVGVNLMGHNLEESDHLEIAMLSNGYGEENPVTVFAGGMNTDGPFSLMSMRGAIVIQYDSLYEQDAVDVVAQALEEYKESFFYSDSQLNFTPLRVSEDGLVAVMAVGEVSAHRGETYVCVFLAQSIPGTTDVIRMDMVLYTDFFEEIDYAILVEFGEHLGLDLLGFVYDLLGNGR